MFVEDFTINVNATRVISIGKDEYFINKKDIVSKKFSNFEPYVLSVSHLYPYKHIPEMIRSFCKVNKNRGMKYKLLIAGSKKSEKYYKKNY